MACLTLISSLVDRIASGDEEVEIYLAGRSIWTIPSMNPDTYDANILSSATVKKQGGVSSRIYGLRRKSQHSVCMRKDKKLYAFSFKLITQ